MLRFAGEKKDVYTPKYTVSDYFLGLLFNPPYLPSFSFPLLLILNIV